MREMAKMCIMVLRLKECRMPCIGEYSEQLRRFPRGMAPSHVKANDLVKVHHVGDAHKDGELYPSMRMGGILRALAALPAPQGKSAA